MNPDRFAMMMQLFEECVELPEHERASFIDRACAGDDPLRDELRSMLEHDEAAGSGDDSTGAPLRSMIDSAMVEALDHEKLPETVGPYRIIRQLGRGGMGIVYEGEQLEPKRRVAVKVVPALASSEHRRRMSQEAQALALIEDPGVARIYESGIAEVFGTRTPYIVMELVDGHPIDEWGVQHDLSVRERLLLIARVADAVQTAHSRGVIHRDLKPTNITVIAERHGPGQPKVLDFGIARLRSSELTFQTMTGPGSSPMGTLQYMSPEQYGSDPALVDARSDIYALGAVAYRLLGGTDPFDMRQATLANAARMVVEETPRSLGSLNRELRGDIEVVIAKAMSKDPARRYQTMEAFASDLRRVLSNEPIMARPPSLSYLLAKFVQRNRVLTVSAAMIAILLGVSFYWIGRERGRAITESQTSAAVSSFIVDMLRSIEPNTARGDEVSVREVLDNAGNRLDLGELDDQPETRARLRIVIGQVYKSLGQYSEAITQIQNARVSLAQLHGGRSEQIARAIELQAQIEILAGRYDDAETNFHEASAMLRQLGKSPLLISADGSLGQVYYWTGRYDECEQFLRDALVVLKDADASEDPRVGHTLSALGSVLEYQGMLDEAIDYHRRGVDAQIAYYGETHTEAAEAYNDYGNTLLAADRYQEALDAHTTALAIRQELLDPRHPEMAVTKNNLALVYIRIGQPAKAIPMLQDTIDIRLSTIGRDHPATCSCLGNLARAYMENGQLELALEAFDEAVEAAEQTVGPDQVMSIVFRANRGDCIARAGRFNEAEPILLAEYDKIVETLGESHFRSQVIAGQIAEMYSRTGDDARALQWIERSGKPGT